MFAPAFTQGFLVTSGLIIAIGAQNAFVLKQGLLKNRIFWVILTCFLCDFILIGIGVMGVGSLISQSPMASVILAVIGALFLAVYGALALLSAIKNSSALSLDETDNQQSSILAAVSTTLAITLLNPHVYLDTLVIIGGVAGTLSLVDKQYFLAGAMLVSALWFISIGYGARILIPLFSKPVTWRIFDAIIAVVMWLIAASLLSFAMSNYQAMG